MNLSTDMRVFVKILDETKRNQFEELLKSLGGTSQTEFSPDIAYCVVDPYEPSISILKCLLQEIPIVTTHYFNHIVKKGQPPKVKNFLPATQPFHKQTFLLPNSKRKSLLNGFTFGFSSERDWKDYSDVIRSAGGETYTTNEINSGDAILMTYLGKTTEVPRKLITATLVSASTSKLIPTAQQLSVEDHIEAAINFYSKEVNQLSENVPIEWQSACFLDDPFDLLFNATASTASSGPITSRKRRTATDASTVPSDSD